jgi:hypothetical protein
MYDKDGRMRQVRLNWEYKAAGLDVPSCECDVVITRVVGNITGTISLRCHCA